MKFLHIIEDRNLERLARSIEHLEQGQAFPHEADIEPLHAYELSTHREFERETGIWIEPNYWPEMTLEPKRVQKYVKQILWTQSKKPDRYTPEFRVSDDKQVYRKWFQRGMAAGKKPKNMLAFWLQEYPEHNSEVEKMLREVVQEFDGCTLHKGEFHATTSRTSRN